MAELGLLVGSTAVAALQAVGLVGVEVADAADFEPTLLGLAIDLEVVADGAGEALVAAAEAQDAIGEFQLLQQPLDMCEHFFMALLGVLGGVDTDNLNLGELVQAVQAAHILAVAACLATEALRVGAVLDGEFLLVEDDIAVDVRDRHLGGGDEVEVIDLGVVHLSFFVWQLACAVAAGSIHDCRRHDLGVAGLVGFGEEEVDEGALQLGSLADIDGEAGAGDLHAQVEVDEIVFLGEFPVGERLLFTTTLSSAAAPSGTSS